MKTPKLTAQVIKFLECHDFEVVNVSYGNDCTDSVLVDGHIRIMLPNSFVNDPDRELFDSFLVIEGEASFEEFIGNTDVLLEVLDYLKIRVMETRKIDLSIDTARIMFNSGDENLKAIALGAYPELKLEELESRFQEHSLQSIREFSEDVYLLALLIAEFNRGWSPNWKDEDEKKWFIYLDMRGDSPAFNCASYNYSDADVPTRLCFETRERAEEFYNLHSNLINKIYSDGQAI